MVASPLVKPLVAPLVGRGASGLRGRSAISKTRILATCLALSALVSVTTNADARALTRKQQEPQTIYRTAHQKPAKTSLSATLARLLFVAPRRDEVQPPTEAPSFENDAVQAVLLRHQLDRSKDLGPGLGLGRRLDRLFGSKNSTFLRFGSGLHQSAHPAP